MDKKKPALPDFTSFLSKKELLFVLAYAPVHIVLLPMLLNTFAVQGAISDTAANFLCYAISAVFLAFVCFKFLRRDFDPLADRPFHCLVEVLTGYFTMMCMNFCVAYIIVLILPNTENPNNADVMELVFKDYGMMKATTVFLAPIVEELIFRASIFGGLYDRNKKLAYAVSALLFALFHVWAYAFAEPVYWVYLLEYIPVALLLARCYERTNSIWCSVFFHMLNNSIAIKTLDMLQEMM